MLIAATALWAMIDDLGRRSALAQGSWLNLAVTRSIANALGALADNPAATHEARAAFRATLLRLTVRIPVLKVKLFDPTGLTPYSTDESNIGERKDLLSDPVARALSGEAADELVFDKTLLDMTGRKVTAHALGSNVPVREQGRIVAAIEIYADISPILANHRALARKILAAVAAVGLLAMSLLLWVAGRLEQRLRAAEAERLHQMTLTAAAERAAQDKQLEEARRAANETALRKLSERSRGVVDTVTHQP